MGSAIDLSCRGRPPPPRGRMSTKNSRKTPISVGGMRAPPRNFVAGFCGRFRSQRASANSRRLRLALKAGRRRRETWVPDAGRRGSDGEGAAAGRRNRGSSDPLENHSLCRPRGDLCPLFTLQFRSAAEVSHARPSAHGLPTRTKAYDPFAVLAMVCK
jgi:hypothetical protein